MKLFGRRERRKKLEQMEIEVSAAVDDLNQKIDTLGALITQAQAEKVSLQAAVNTAAAGMVPEGVVAAAAAKLQPLIDSLQPQQ